MTAGDDGFDRWLPVIGKSLAFLCLREAMRSDPNKFDSVLAKVRFLEGLGLDRNDAAEAAGSSAESVRELHRRSRKRGANRGSARKKKGR